MVDRAVSRLRDIKNSIDEMKALLSGRSLAELSTDTIRRAASNVSWRFSAKPRGMFRIRGRPNGPGYPGERSRRSGIEYATSIASSILRSFGRFTSTTWIRSSAP